MTALEKDVDRRFQTAQDMQIALEDYLRTESRPSTNADLSGFMRGLFADKMEEKRRLVELASRDDFLQAYAADDEVTENNPNGTKRRVVYGRPSDIRVSGVLPAAQGTPHGHMVPGATASFAGMQGGSGNFQLPPGMTQAQAQAYFQSQSHAAPYAETSNWGPRIVIAVALMVIVFASAYLWMELRPKPQPVLAPPVETRIGWLEIDSVPDGATIYVDDNPVPLESGEHAKTPIEQLTPLEYGREYRIRLIKSGYEPYNTTVTMGDDMVGKLIKPTLEAIPATLIAEVRGEPYEVKIFFNGREKGFSTKLTEKVNPGPIKVTAEADDWYCKATPETIQAEAGGTERTTITCQKTRPRAAAPPPTRSPGKKRNPRKGTGTKPKLTGPAGCRADTGAPHGYVTISTKPYSTIFWNGKKLGDTPLNKEKLPAGCVELEAVHPGPPKKVKKVRVKVESNRTLRYRFDL